MEQLLKSYPELMKICDFLGVVPEFEIKMAIRLVLAAILGGIVGLERGSNDRPAGFRTHILVCMGSTLFMLVSMYGFDEMNAILGGASVDSGARRDSARIAAQVVSGIGFLGAGTILHEGLTIKGLTTAASLWMVSAIGLAVGSGMYVLSVVATILTMVTLITLHTWEKRYSFKNTKERRFIRITAQNHPGMITDITGYLALNGIKVKNLNVKNDFVTKNLVLELYLTIDPELDTKEIIQGITDIEGVISLENAK